MVIKIPYERLPAGVRAQITDVAGFVINTVAVHDGRNSAVAALLETPHRCCFVKALPTDHRWAWTQAREAEVSQHVSELGAPLIMRLVHDGWDVLIFERVPGHQANYVPGSPDLPAVATLLARVGEVPLPDIDLRVAEQRLQPYAPAADLHHFGGETLLHTDLNYANVLVDGPQARLVDWGWATRGAAWLDAGYWVIWLIAAGHPAASAERWASRIPAWRTAPPTGINAFAAANARVWADIAGTDPDAWTRRLVEASVAWQSYRATKPHL